MTRASCGADKKLISIARGIVEKEGFSGLTVRGLASRAGINLGLFHYHFRNKARFKRQVLQAIYEDFFKDFSLEAKGEGSPLERLRATLLFLARWARERRGLIFSLVMDAVGGDKQTVDFLQANLGRHFSIVTALILRCQKEKIIRNLPLVHIVPVLFGTVGFPKFISAGLERSRAGTVLGMPRKEFIDAILSDRAIEDRLDIVLRGLKVP